MPNPRYLTERGEPTVELLQKISIAKRIYYDNLKEFCSRNFIDLESMQKINEVYVIGSHAFDEGWNNDTSDLDLKLINEESMPDNLWKYKRDVLDPRLHEGEKFRWIDLFFARRGDQVLDPKWDVTKYWHDPEI